VKPVLLFRFCPRCGAPSETEPREDTNEFRCGRCALRYFFNPTVAVAVFVTRHDGRTLFIRRAREPAKGRLAPPGGFIDIGETAENAARRELREEVGLDIRNVEFLCSHPNSYVFAEVTYPVVDLFFTAEAVDASATADAREVSECLWLDPLEVAAGELAFPSMRHAMEIWQARLRARRDP